MTTHKCWCRQCVQDRQETVNGMPYETAFMILCCLCGNKRCPHATDHRQDCTKSNAPGQKGSVYE